MKLIELLKIVESQTSVSIYISNKTLWNAKNEKHLISDNPFGILTKIDKELLNCEVIGLKVNEIFNNLHICIYKG